MYSYQNLAVGGTVSGSTTDNYGSDVYKVTLEKLGILTVSIEFYNIDSYVRIYDMNGIELTYDYIFYNSALGVSKASLAYPLIQGSYYIVVHPDSYYGYSYRLSTSYKGSAESFIETNGGTNNYLYQASAVKTNKTYNGQITYNDSRDIYEFTLTKKTTLAINEEVDEMTNKFKLKEKVTLEKGTYYFTVTGFEQKQYQYYRNYSLSFLYQFQNIQSNTKWKMVLLTVQQHFHMVQLIH